MAVHRVIYRLDFKTNFEYMNRPGDAAKLLTEAKGDLFKEVGETRGQWRQLVAKFKDEKFAREMTVEPKSFIAAIEWVDGISLDALAEDPSFGGTIKLMSHLCTAFHVNEFTRAGFRIWLLERTGLGSNAVLERMLEGVAQPLRRPGEQHLGPPTDIGLAVDGKSEAKVSYHLRIGPYRGKDEAPKYFPSLADKYPEETLADFVIDVDQYEESFTYGTETAKKWWKPLAENAGKLAEQYLKQFAHR